MLARGRPIEATGGEESSDVGLLTRKQLAQHLRVSCRSVDNMQARRQIPFLRLSRRCIRFDLQAVRRALVKFEIKEAGRRQ
jgi:hypothetical protein